MPLAQVPERELPLIQKGIIDNCFEEGQYEYGIDVLDKLRGHGYKPPPLYIRQLVYISLYPPPPPLPNRVPDCGDVPPSPQKVQFQRQKEDLWPKPTTRPRAIALLNAYVGSNSPECLMRGLPFHSYINNEDVKDVDPFREETMEDDFEDNSPLKSELSAFQSLKDCWGLLRGGFVKRKQSDRTRGDDGHEPGQLEDSIVGPYAWPVLEWLIEVFEKDERRGKTPYSALLLSHIPQPRSRSGPRWDAETPLRVALACFCPVVRNSDQPHEYTSTKLHCNLGVRLISLLINLTLTRPPLLSPSPLLRSLALRLRDLPLTSLQAFLSTIPTSQTNFKVSLLEYYIFLENDTDGESMRIAGATVPQAQLKLMGNPKDISTEVLSGTLTSGGTRERCKDPYPLPSLSSFLNSISTPLMSASTPDPQGLSASTLPLPNTNVALTKFHLVSALCNLHLSRSLPGPQWNAAAREGKLRKSVLDGFSIRAYLERNITVDTGARLADDEQKINSYMAAALGLIQAWETSLTTE